jgi:tetratricopeptide (TPR) repeat protein
MAALVILGVGGYAAYQLVPGIPLLSPRQAAALRRIAGGMFVDALLIAYPLTLLTSILGTVVLTCLFVWRRRQENLAGARTPSKNRWQSRLLLLCVSTILSLAGFEAGAALWRAKLHQSPELPSNVGPRTSAEAFGDSRMPPKLVGEAAGSLDGVRRMRILVIGESSGRGEPYHPWLSVAQIVAWKLEKIFPERSIEVDMWATGGAILEMMHKKLAGLDYRPDALMVYVGHNEFQTRYAWMREIHHYLDEDPVLSRARRHPAVNLFLRVSPLYQLLDETREHQRLDAMPPHLISRQLVDRPLCTDAEVKAMAEDFRQRLGSIARFCEALGTLPIFVIPPCNDAGWEPSRSFLEAATPRAERAAFAREVKNARALEVTDRTGALRTYRELVQRHPEFAETHYRLGRLLEQSGDWAEARDHYIQARELDGMPLRCPETLRQAYQIVAASHPSVLLVDGPKVLEARSRHGFTDGGLFHDAQHPNLEGYVALAENLMTQLRARSAFGWPDEKPVPMLDALSCARHFDLNAARWAEVCERDCGFFRAAAFIRFEPGFRIELSEQYRRAGDSIKKGNPPALAGIPGWPLPPAPANSHRILHGSRPEP